MLVADGEQRLAAFAATAFPPTVTGVVPDRVFHVLGHGHSNATFIIGDTSVVLIDTLDTGVRGARLKALIAGQTAKPVRTIIYTHGHPDHRGGAGAFADTVTEIIAFAPVRPPLARTGQVARILDRRGIRQMGYELTDAEAISQGYGPREGFTVGDGERQPLPPTTLYTGEAVRRTIDGIDLLLEPAPGESEDQCLIWLPEEQVLVCGDNFSGCWPNLYAIRGGPYRDVAAWIASLDRLRDLPAVALLPGHTRPILGRAGVADVLTNFRDALDYVLTETLACLDRGLGLEETAATVTLPPHLRDLPYLQEFYGTVPWSVRSIYTGYVGWFDGNAAHLNPLAPRERARRFVAQMGGPETVAGVAEQALAAGDVQWAVELADLLLTLDPANRDYRRAMAAGLRALGAQETSANGRHYYLASARELLSSG